MLEDNNDHVSQPDEGIVDDIDFEPVHEKIPVTLEIVSVSKFVPKIELDEVEELSDDNNY